MQRPTGGMNTPMMYQQQQPQFQQQPMTQTPSQQQPSNLVKLKYRVIYCSGEDPEYPVTELLDPTPNSRGWQSQKFCEYPQEIIVQFANIVKLKQLQFLSHQSKISSKIELFTYVPTSQQQNISQLALSEIQFKRLGYLSLDPNERSGFQARELKSVYVDSMAILLKLIFHKCHLNNFNVFNQIGLVALNCIGVNMNPNQIAQEMGVDTMPTSQQSAKRNEFEAQSLDPEIANKIKLLEQAKNKAAAMENFDEAKQIKDGMDRMKSIGLHLQQLEERKRMATLNEDYDAAKIIKMEMDKLRQAAFNPWLEEIIQKMLGGGQQNPRQMRGTQQQFNGPSPQAQFGNSQQNFQMGFNKGSTPQMAGSLEEDFSGKMNMGAQPGGFRMQSPKMMNQQDAMSPPSMQNQLPINNRDFGGPRKGSEQDQMYGKQLMPQEPVDVDSQVIPTLGNKAKSVPQEYENGQEEDGKDAEPLTGDNIVKAQPLIQVFGEPDVRKIFSRTWQLRDEGISNIEQTALQGDSDEAEAFVNGIGVVRYTVGDKMAQVSQRSMAFLTNLCRTLRPSIGGSLRGELQSYTDPILQALTEKLGDNLVKVRTAAEDALLAMAEHPSFGVQTCFNVISRAAPPAGAKQDAKKALVSNKHIIGKYSVLLKMLQSFDFTPDLQKQAVKFTLKGVQHQLQDVRNVAYKCMSELYRFMGPDIKQYLTELRPAQMEQLEAQFAEVDGDSGAPLKKAKTSVTPKETIVTNIDPKGNKGKSTTRQQTMKKPQYDEEEEDHQPDEEDNYYGKQQQQFQKSHKPQQKQPIVSPEQTCPFCGRFDDDFNEESLDIHYWKECPMLIQCWECGQVIEIATFDEHLLEECESREDYKLCSKCKSVFRVDEFNNHECIRAKPAGAVKCQLCRESVHPANEIGWKRHIMDEKCVGNNRIPH